MHCAPPLPEEEGEDGDEGEEGEDGDDGEEGEEGEPAGRQLLVSHTGAPCAQVSVQSEGGWADEDRDTPRRAHLSKGMRVLK